MKVWEVQFGDLVHDDEVAQYYLVLMATLKAARKRGIVYFEGELLVKGAHDMVPITLLQPPRATR
jgi:hypothetical protein